MEIIESYRLKSREEYDKKYQNSSRIFKFLMMIDKFFKIIHQWMLLLLIFYLIGMWSNQQYQNNYGGSRKFEQRILLAIFDESKLIELQIECYGNEERRQVWFGLFENLFELERLGRLTYQKQHLYALMLEITNLFQQALERYEILIQENPENAKNYIRKGQFLFRRKRYDEAEKAFDLAIELDDDNFLAHYSKSVMLFEISKQKKANES